MLPSKRSGKSAWPLFESSLSACRECGLYYMSPIMIKPAFCICENKCADQLCGNHAADQHLCFRYIDTHVVQCLYLLNKKFRAFSYLLWLYSLVFSSPEPLGSQGELIVYPLSRRSYVIRPSSTIFKDLLSETACPIKAKFYVEPSWEGGTKVYINGPGHMYVASGTQALQSLYK